MTTTGLVKPAQGGAGTWTGLVESGELGADGGGGTQKVLYTRRVVELRMRVFCFFLFSCGSTWHYSEAVLREEDERERALLWTHWLAGWLFGRAGSDDEDGWTEGPQGREMQCGGQDILGD